MDVQILKQLYQKLDNLDNFNILTNNNYDPDKKLLYKLLEFLSINNLITRVEINLICDTINKLLSKEYNKNEKYFDVGIKTNIYDVIVLLIKSHININDDELKILNVINSPSKIIELLIQHHYTEQLIKYFISNGKILEMNDKFVDIFIDKVKNKLTTQDSDLVEIYIAIKKSKFQLTLSEDLTKTFYNVITKIKDVNVVDMIVKKYKFSTKININDITEPYGYWGYIGEIDNIDVIKYLITNKLLDIKTFKHIKKFEKNEILKLMISSYKDEITTELLTNIIIESKDPDVINYIITEFKYNNKIKISSIKSDPEEKIKILLNKDLIEIDIFYDLNFSQEIQNLILSKFKDNYNVVKKFLISTLNINIIKELLDSEFITLSEFKNFIVEDRLMHLTTVYTVSVDKIKLLLNNKILTINEIFDCFIEDILQYISQWKDNEIPTSVNLILDIQPNLTIKCGKIKRYQIKFKEKGIEYIYNDIINILNKRTNTKYELLKIPKITFKIYDQYAERSTYSYDKTKTIVEFNSMKKLEDYVRDRFSYIIGRKQVLISYGFVEIGATNPQKIGEYEIL